MSALRDRLLQLAKDIEAAPTDEDALTVMRAATGLTVTDPDIDRAILAARLAAAGPQSTSTSD